MNEVLAIAAYRMRRELEEAVREDDEVRELLDRVVSRELDPASAATAVAGAGSDQPLKSCASSASSRTPNPVPPRSR